MEREVNQGKSQPENRIEKSERLSDEQLGNLISAVGNHEAKALTLLTMKKGIIYSRQNMYNEFVEMQGDNKAWIPSAKGPLGYCANSLAPIGLVAKEYVDENFTTYGFVKTDFGDKIGVPFAGLMLNFSERYPTFSLINIFGSTSSNALSSKTIVTPEGNIEYKERSPITRLKIFWELLTNTLPIRVTDLARLLENNVGHTSQHLAEMNKIGIVQHHFNEPDKAYALYSLVDPTKQLCHYFPERPTLTQYIYEILCEHASAYVTAQQVNEFLLERYSELNILNAKNLRSSVSGILSFLAKYGYVSKGKFDLKIRSEINLTIEQRSALLDLVSTLYRFQQQDPSILEKGRKKAEQIISDPQRVSKLLHKTRTFSPHINSTSRDITRSRILTLVQEKPHITSREIVDRLKSEYGQKIGIVVIQRVVRLLVEDKLIKVNRKGASYYSCLTKEDEPKD